MFLRRKNASRKRNRLKFETLSDRLVLSANPLAPIDAPAGEGHSHTIEEQGSLVTVLGGDDADIIRIEMGTSEHLLTINGESHEYDASVVDEIVVAGMGGDDSVTVVGSTLNDLIEIEDGQTTLRNGKYVARVQQAEIVRVVGAGGRDTVKIYDSNGDDSLFMHPTFTTFVNADGDTFKVSGVEQVEAFADNGGVDRVRFYDSPADDKFVAKTQFAYMIGDDFWNYAKNFESIDAFQRSGGQDNAEFYGSDGDDVLVARPDNVLFTTANGIRMASHDFFTTRTSGEGGNDSAEVFGQDHVEDKFVWRQDSAYMYTNGVVDSDGLSEAVAVTPITASNIFVGFGHIEATGGGPDDRAELRGSVGDDRVIALPEVVVMTTDLAEVEAIDFRIVRSHGKGGNDRAQLQDSSQSDKYISNPEFAYLAGDDYLNYVTGFSIDAFALNPGDDYANAKDYTGPDNDYLVFDGNQFLIWGPDRQERVHGFTRARGDGVGPAGFQLLNQITHAFTLGGSHDQNDIPTDELTQQMVDRANEAFTIYEYVDGELRPAPTT